MTSRRLEQLDREIADVVAAINAVVAAAGETGLFYSTKANHRALHVAIGDLMIARDEIMGRWDK